VLIFKKWGEPKVVKGALYIALYELDKCSCGSRCTSWDVEEICYWWVYFCDLDRI